MGFAAEIKEFLGAAKDSWKLMSDTEHKQAQDRYTQAKTDETIKEMNDPLNQQLKEAKLAHTLRSTANIGRETPLQRLQAQYYQSLIDAQKNPPPNPVVGSYVPGSQRGAGGAAYGKPQDETVPDEGPQKSNFRKGGMVQKFAIGGMAEDDDDEVTSEVTPGALPPAIGGLPTDFSGQRRSVPMPVPRNMTNVDAVSAGLKYGASRIPPPTAIPSPGRQRALQGYARGAGAAPVDDMISIYEHIDPKGKMGESERNLEAIGALYRFKMNQNDQEGAARAASAMLQHYKVAATRYAAIAKAAFDGGEVDAGIKALLKSYANVPDGMSVKLSMGKNGGVNYTITDPDGTETKRGLASPQQMADVAMEIGTKGIEPYILNAAGMQAKKRAGGAAGALPGVNPVTGEKAPAEENQTKIPKPGEQTELRGQIKQSVDEYVSSLMASDKYKQSGKKIEPKEIAQMNEVAYHIMRNNDKPPEESIRLAHSFITAPEATKKGEKAPFKVFRDEEDKTVTIRWPNGEIIEMADRDYAGMRQARVNALEERAADAKKQADEAKETEARGGKSKVMSALGKADEYFHAIGGDPDNPQSEYPEFVKGKTYLEKEHPEFVARGQSAVNAGKRAAADALQWFKDQKDKPAAWETDVAGPVNRAVGAIPALTANPNLPPEYTEDRPL